MGKNTKAKGLPLSQGFVMSLADRIRWHQKRYLERSHGPRRKTEPRPIEEVSEFHARHLDRKLRKGEGRRIVNRVRREQERARRDARDSQSS